MKGLRVYLVEGDSAALEVPPPPSPRRYWTRRGIAMWLADRLAEDIPTLVGIDHGFSFPKAYFDAHQLQDDWLFFLDDFQKHWSTDAQHTRVDDWLRDADRDGRLRAALNPELAFHERAVAGVEGWILGVG